MLQGGDLETLASAVPAEENQAGPQGAAKQERAGNAGSESGVPRICEKKKEFHRNLIH